MAAGRRSESGRSQTSWFSFWMVPVTVLLVRSTILTIRAVLRPGWEGSASTAASTVSPSQAPFSRRGGTKLSSPRPAPSSGMKKPKPRPEPW